MLAATRPEMYYAYFHMVCWLAPIGWTFQFYKPTPARYFLIFSTAIAYYFSGRMVRLVLILGPG